MAEFNPRLFGPALSSRATRRGFLFGAAALAATGVLAACGGGGSSSDVSADELAGPPDPAKAKAEGSVVVWHSQNEAQMNSYLQATSAALGFTVEGLRLASSDIVQKLRNESLTRKHSVDVVMASDPSLPIQANDLGFVQQYVSPEMDAYPDEYKSSPVGIWTSYYTGIAAIGFDPGHVTAADAPKTYDDLLNPKWANRLAFQDTTAGSQYIWWYIMRQALPASWFEELKSLKPTGYGSSTAIIQELRSGNMLVAGKVSDFQFVQAVRDGQPLTSVYPDLGVPMNPDPIFMAKDAPHLNAAKMFIDYSLSVAGQTSFNTIQGSRSGRPDVTIEGVTPISNYNLLTLKSSDYADFVLPERSAEFKQVWGDIIGTA